MPSRPISRERCCPARLLLPGLPVLALLALLAGCSDQPPADLTLADLTAGERLYVTRLVVLERAKAVALVDRPTGNALLDSLAVAWGDSARADSEAGVPGDPLRAGQLATLLTRVLEAELDSLLTAPLPRRLAAPLPEPRAAPADPAEEDPGAR